MNARTFVPGFPFLAVAATLLLAASVFAEPYTPKRGSAERTAICDGLRRHFSKQRIKPLPKKIVFVIDELRVEDGFAAFEGMPQFEDGSSAIEKGYMPDVGYTALLQRDSSGNWNVILDLSRSDVPSEQEIRAIRRQLPREFPTAVLPEFWRNLLRA